ncbi:MAG: hypothetical protein JRJ85_12665 [Deltaproteobacteria bacterium]|nr:hypothetical protein [Deltaproteobacteria bacterium]
MKKDILSGIPSFSGLSENQLEEIQQIIIHKHLNKGEPIFIGGEVVRHIQVQLR